MPDEKHLESAYEELYSSAGQTEEINDPEYWGTAGEAYRKDLLYAVTAHGLSGQMVDFGAGWGHLCEMLIENGLNCKGVEVSSEMSAYGKSRGLPIVQGSFDALKKMENISHIVMCAVFELLTDHHQWLRRFNGLLPIGGTIVSLHPTAACYSLVSTMVRLGKRNKELPELHGSFSPPWHTAFFSLKAMEIIAGKNGFKVVDILPASQGNVGGVTGYIQQALGLVNRIGWRVMGRRWPLVTTHIFVLKKIKDLE